MTTWEDVVTRALSLPEVTVSTWYRTPALKIAGKGFARLRTEAEGGLLLTCTPDEKAALLASGDPAFYTTPHYDGHASIIIDLALVDPAHLFELLTESHRLKAPPKLRATLD